MRHQLTCDADIPLPTFIIESLNQDNKRDYGLTAKHRSIGPATVGVVIASPLRWLSPGLGEAHVVFPQRR
jgi:hypothetical protein